MLPGPMTRRQVRWVDQWATGTLGARAEILMENAGRCAAAAAEDLVRAVAEPRVAVLAGSGNNAGDGFVVARHLRIRNIAADVYLLGDRDKFSGEALMNLRLCERLLGPVREVRGRSAGDLAALWRPYDLLVDALGGTGITGALRGDLAAGVQAANATGLPILAIDIPTGMDCDTGAAPGPVIRARQTITFVARKLGFDAAGAAEFTGKVTVADIGIPVQDVPEPE